MPETSPVNIIGERAGRRIVDVLRETPAENVDGFGGEAIGREVGDLDTAGPVIVVAGAESDSKNCLVDRRLAALDGKDDLLAGRVGDGCIDFQLTQEAIIGGLAGRIKSQCIALDVQPVKRHTTGIAQRAIDDERRFVAEEVAKHRGDQRGNLAIERGVETEVRRSGGQGGFRP